MTAIDTFVLFAYFAVMIGIGLWSMRRVKNQEDYFMGGRGFGKLLQTFAAFGAGTGAHEPVQVGRTGWTSGLSGVWSALMWLFVTPVYWITAVWYRRMRHLTLGDWFVERYESKGLGIAYACFAVVFYMYYLSTMLSAIAGFAVPLMGIEQLWGFDLQSVLIPGLAFIVILYGVLGGLTAAYYTDLIQGLFIILLSLLLIPFGLWALVQRFGDPATMGLYDGFVILHERVDGAFFNLFGGPSAGEFPPQYILSLSILGLVGIVVQPHFIATGGGSAKTEYEARVGLLVGNFLKRLCTVGWALTALIALALLAGNAEIVADPDRVWGVATREILGPLNLGLVGLMLACLMAAMMSSADAYMIVTSALITRNVFAVLKPNASEKTYVLVGRLTGLTIIVGASAIAVANKDVFGQFKAAIELPILFAAPFWIGMYWRRANKTAVWMTLLCCLMLFFVLPKALPWAYPGLRTSERFAITTQKTTTTLTRDATAADVAAYEGWLAKMNEVRASGTQEDIDSFAAKEPPKAMLGESFSVKTSSGDQAVFWTGGIEWQDQAQWEEVLRESDSDKEVVVEKRTAPVRGKGDFRIDFLVYAWLGFDLSQSSKATLETLRLPTRVILPFALLILFSLLTPRTSQRGLDRFYAKMNTPVDGDPDQDLRNLEKAYEQPDFYAEKKMFGGDLEFVWPTKLDIFGFLASILICGAIIGLLVWLAGIGA